MRALDPEVRVLMCTRDLTLKLLSIINESCLVTQTKHRNARVYHTINFTDLYITCRPIELVALLGSLDLPRRGAHAWKTGLMVVECLSGILTSACPLVLQV